MTGKTDSLRHSLLRGRTKKGRFQLFKGSIVPRVHAGRNGQLDYDAVHRLFDSTFVATGNKGMK